MSLDAIQHLGRCIDGTVVEDDETSGPGTDQYALDTRDLLEMPFEPVAGADDIAYERHFQPQPPRDSVAHLDTYKFLHDRALPFHCKERSFFDQSRSNVTSGRATSDDHFSR